MLLSLGLPKTTVEWEISLGVKQADLQTVGAGGPDLSFLNCNYFSSPTLFGYFFLSFITTFGNLLDTN